MYLEFVSGRSGKVFMGSPIMACQLIYFKISSNCLTCILSTILLQMKRKLPKVNRRLANQILEDEEAEKEKKDEDTEKEKKDDVNKTKKASKKKKGFSSEIFQDERFSNMFKNEVWLSSTPRHLLFDISVTYFLSVSKLLKGKEEKCQRLHLQYI